MSQDNELRSIFQDKFSAAEVKATPTVVWNGLEQQLAAMRSKRKKRLFYFWLSSGFLLLVGIGAAIYAMNNFDTVEPNTFVNDQTSLQTTNSTEQQVESQSQVKEDENNFSGNNSATDELITPTTDNERVNTQIGAEDVTQNNQKTNGSVSKGNLTSLSGASKDDEAGQFTKKDFGDDPVVTSTKQVNKTTVEETNVEKTEKDGDTPEEGTTKKDPLVQNQVDVEEGIEKEDLKTEKKTTQLNLASTNEMNEENRESEERVGPIDERDKTPISKIEPTLAKAPPLVFLQPLPPDAKWEISFNIAAGRQVRRSTLDADSQSSANFSGSGPTRQLFTTYGMKFNYLMGDHFLVGFGLETSLWRYRTKNYQKQLVIAPQYEFDSPVGRLQVNQQDIESLYPAGSASDTILVTMRMFQRLRYIGIPISFQYEFGKGKVRPYIRFGAVCNLLVRQRTILFAERGNVQREVNYKNLEGFNRFQLTLQPAFGVNWKLNDKVSMFGEGLLNLPATKFYKAPDASLQKISSQGRGASIGIRLKL